MQEVKDRKDGVMINRYTDELKNEELQGAEISDSSDEDRGNFVLGVILSNSTFNCQEVHLLKQFTTPFIVTP